jgi:hypothetical protein
MPETTTAAAPIEAGTVDDLLASVRTLDLSFQDAPGIKDRVAAFRSAANEAEQSAETRAAEINAQLGDRYTEKGASEARQEVGGQLASSVSGTCKRLVSAILTTRDGLSVTPTTPVPLSLAATSRGAEPTMTEALDAAHRIDLTRRLILDGASDQATLFRLIVLDGAHGADAGIMYAVESLPPSVRERILEQLPRSGDGKADALDTLREVFWTARHPEIIEKHVQLGEASDWCEHRLRSCLRKIHAHLGFEARHFDEAVAIVAPLGNEHGLGWL